ncbi:hypothetical protein AYO38_01075 [bacterium SCGC AG-212-C10]|nr:hypothetical protein AYO38_01075 [bacterium SCGC AG-212-C10]
MLTAWNDRSAVRFPLTPVANTSRMSRWPPGEPYGGAMNNEKSASPVPASQFGRPVATEETIITNRTAQRQRELDKNADDGDDGLAVPGDEGTGTGQVDDRNKQADEENLRLRRAQDQGRIG